MDKKSLLEELIKNYRQTHKKSEEFFQKAVRYEIRGGSHTLRLFAPFPFYDIRSSGSKVTDIDGNTYVDFWQGHFANVLGHNPPIVINALLDYFQKGQGLQTGFPGSLQKELAELILTKLNTDKIRFTTSGTLASMYAVMLSKAYTQRDFVFKIGGGWHGSQPFALKGISIYDMGLNNVESAGLPMGIDSTIIMTKFNDIADLEEKFNKFGEQASCLIVEPFIGAGGLIFGLPEYLSKVRELCDKYGVVLIFDEIISGFRFHAGVLHTLYDIKPDLTLLGKVIGGGMPLSAVAGKEELMTLCSPDAEDGKKVKFEGGTFSAHPSSMLAGITFIKYLSEHENEIYPRIGQLGKKVRKGIEDIFNSYGFNVRCSGNGGSIAKNSSIVGVHFLNPGINAVYSPEVALNPEESDIEMRVKIFKLAMLEEGFHVMDGYGAISLAHSDEEIQESLDAVERIAKKWQKFR